jgi:prepilin peptidase CpaA
VLSVVWLAFVAIMAAAAVTDVMSYRIPNGLVIALFALFVVAAALNWSEVPWVSHVAAAAIVFGAGVLLYAIGQMGAGDVKLLSVVALWSGIFPLPRLMVFVSFCGLIGMLVILALRMIAPRLQPNGPSGKRALPRVLTKGQGIPYAIAIGPGAILATSGFAPWLWRW